MDASFLDGRALTKSVMPKLFNIATLLSAARYHPAAHPAELCGRRTESTSYTLDHRASIDAWPQDLPGALPWPGLPGDFPGG